MNVCMGCHNQICSATNADRLRCEAEARNSSSPRPVGSAVLTVEIGEDGKCTEKGKADIRAFLDKHLPPNAESETLT